jgi:hypothetical protein
VFQAKTFTFWTADTNELPWTARGDWRPLFGEHHGTHEGLLVGASGALTTRETADLCPFDLAAAVAPQDVDLENVTVEQFKVMRKYARPLARHGIERREANACQGRYVPGRCRNLHVNTRIEALASEPILLPVWMMAYRYRDRPFRFLINGQTGRATGEAPTSWKKVGTAVALGVVAVLIILGMIAMAGH